MALTSADLARIVEGASNLAERLRGDFESTGSDDGLARRRLLRWRELAAGNDPARFNRLLQNYGVADTSEAELLGRLGTVKKKPESPWPAWALLLSPLVESIAAWFASGARSGSDAGRRGKIPYRHLFEPVEKFAWGQVERTCPAAHTLLKPSARRGFQNYLARRLANILALPLHTVFSAHKAFRYAGALGDEANRLENVTGQTTDHWQYEAFVVDQGKDGLRSFFLRNPVAARLTAEVVQFWIAFVQEFLRHLEADRTELAAVFHSGQPLGKLAAVQAGVSDPHRQGRGVLLLSFEGGLRLVYKPRPMEIDRAFFRLAEALNRSGETPEVRVPKVCARADHGWMEFTAHHSCPSRQAAQRFYQRAGALTCLLHWLQAIDCHRENLIACGEYPVLTDLETVAHPPGPQERDSETSGTPWSLDGSVLRTGLLPLWYVRPAGGALMDNSGLGAGTIVRSPMPTCRWFLINTDRMEPRYDYWPSRHRTHRPHRGGKALSIKSNEAKLLAGYRQMAKLLAGAGATRYTGWREAAFLTPRRRVKRPTLVYAFLLQRSLSQGCLIHGVDRSIELQALPCLDGDETESAEEIASLEQQDIPYFQHGVTNTPGAIPVQPKLLDQEEVLKLSLWRKLRLEQAAIRRL